ncbi:fasciclin domain-containing protein [Actinomadura parmotrematis]|uniref:Fasciclin domain-containing protein n=1 Tax=Actinomadura parmotrematis TaxID=2864039 RepID=A0ABS7FLX9_9ACTN|nr:fasciclin domain-containing protein [Actinomadura parmotrematis]MBW8481361.1 fasciclin domain-containing protein [Actinomadura parmotrematis]
MNARIIGTAALTAGLAFGLVGCGSGDDKTSNAVAGKASSAASSMSGSPAASQPFGPACSSVPSSGKGSFAGMAEDPVATAASNNPALSTLVTAVKKAGLVDTLNSAPALTVFAPTNDAFAKIPKKTLDAVLADKKKLTDILTYHVVPGKQAPAALDNGSFKSLQGGTVTTMGSGTSYKVNDTANVVCGNVQTRNATVYIIDTVLMPK